jgi:hypothetical protein
VPFDYITSRLLDGPVNGRDVFLQLVEEFPIEWHKQLEQLDVAIDRTIKQLMQMKTMKQMYRQLEPSVLITTSGKRIPPQRELDS